MFISKIKNIYFLNFIFSVDETLKKSHNAKIVRNKNEIIVYLIPTNAPEEFKSIKKLFRFQKSCCTYEYGCIRLDFTKDFDNYLKNLNSSLLQ